MSWFVYMVRCSDGTLYTGTATDVTARVRRHNAGTGARYTRSRRPVRLVWFAAVPGGRGPAQRREAAIKRLRRAKKLALIEEFWERRAKDIRAEVERDLAGLRDVCWVPPDLARKE